MTADIRQPFAAECAVQVLTPTGRDAELCGELLERDGIPVAHCESMEALIDRTRQGSGPLVVSQEALSADTITRLCDALDDQPPWSDIAVLVFAQRRPAVAIQRLALRRSTTLLPRPIDVAMFVGVVRTAVLSRARQYEVRDLLIHLGTLNDRLEWRARELRRLAEQLSNAEQHERTRIAHVLHDHLQQILSAAKMGLGTIRYQGDDDPAVVAAVAKVDGLLSQAIDASRSLTYELSPPFLRHSSLGASIEWLAEHMRQKFGLAVAVDVAQEPNVLSESVRGFLFQSLRELLFNVTKHANTSAARVAVAIHDSELHLEVSDDGCGFDAHSLRSGGGSGEGFGLFGIQERLSLLGGRLQVSSLPGRGSSFGLHLPLSAAEIASQQSMAPPAPVSPPTNRAEDTDNHLLRILVADDHRVMRDGLVSLLEGEPDFEVVGLADNGEEALQLARLKQPDVVLMDVSMPILNGIEATRLLHRELPHVQVIGLSMFAENEIKQRMLDAGAVAYLPKSGDLNDLLSTLRTCRGAARGRN